MPKIPGFPFEPCRDRGFVIIKNRHALNTRVVIQADPEGNIVRQGSTGSSSFYYPKPNALAFGGLTPGQYRVLAEREGTQRSLSVDVTAGGVHEMVLRLGHPLPENTRKKVTDNVTCEPTIFPHEEEEEPRTSGTSGATERYLMSLEPSTRPPRTKKRKKKRGPIAVWQDHHALSRYDLPVLDLINNERRYLDSHIAVYTGMRFDFLLLHYFCSELLRELIPEEPKFADVRWLRHPFDKSPGKYRWGDIRDFLQNIGGRVNDNNEAHAWFLLACNPHLFGNTLVDEMESTVDYYYNSMGVIDIKLPEKFAAILDGAGLLPSHCPDCQKKRESAYKSLSDALEAIRPKDKPGGVLLQILVPQPIVNKTAYITRTSNGTFLNGTPEKDHPDCLKTLLQIRTTETRDIPHYTTLQVRLLTSRLVDPDSGVIIYEITKPGSKITEQYRKHVATIVKDIVAFHRETFFVHCK